MRTLHDGADRHAERLTAILALVDTRPRTLAQQFGNAITCHAATRAIRAIRPQHRFKMRASCVFIVVDWVAKIGAGAGHVGLPFNSAAILQDGSWYVNLIIPF